MANQKNHSPKHLIVGFVLSLLLTFAALLVILETPFVLGVKLTIIYVLAFLQFLVQLIFFMHITENAETKIWTIINTAYAIFIAVVTVVGSIWVMLYNTMHI
jgi:cytochrome aa3 quinol oxidase subunit IV